MMITIVRQEAKPLSLLTFFYQILSLLYASWPTWKSDK